MNWKTSEQLYLLCIYNIKIIDQLKDLRIATECL